MRSSSSHKQLAVAVLVLAACPTGCAVPDLETLGYHFGTDKSHDDHKYTDLYGMLFAPLRRTARNITEIGIAAGQSMCGCGTTSFRRRTFGASMSTLRS